MRLPDIVHVRWHMRALQTSIQSRLCSDGCVRFVEYPFTSSSRLAFWPLNPSSSQAHRRLAATERCYIEQSSMQDNSATQPSSNPSILAEPGLLTTMLHICHTR